MTQTLAVLLVVTLLGLSGCASSAPPPPPRVGPVDHVRRVAILGTGESKFTMIDDRIASAGADVDRIVTEVARWLPGWYGAIVAPLAKLVYSVFASGADEKLAASTASRIGQLSPRAIVADAFARRLAESGQFQEVSALDREPVGDERRRVDVIVRVTVPTWGLMRVREGKPDLLAAYADVRGEMVVGTTGTVVWQHDEDVTHPERLPLSAFTADRELARHELVDVLQRAGQRMATELLYARGVAR